MDELLKICLKFINIITFFLLLFLIKSNSTKKKYITWICVKVSAMGSFNKCDNFIAYIYIYIYIYALEWNKIIFISFDDYNLKFMYLMIYMKSILTHLLKI